MTKQDNNEDIYDDKNLVPNNWIKFSKIGDRISGTLVAVRKVQSRLPGAQEGDLVWVYEMKAKSGEFHDTDASKKVIEPAIILEAGDIWNVGGGKVSATRMSMIDAQLRNIKLGTIIAIKFTEEKPSQTKGFNAQKIKKVFVPKGTDGRHQLDAEWVSEQEFGEETKPDAEIAF